jgi:hypothetical protein
VHVLVHHGGASSAGEYAHTLQLVDVATGWSERVALLGRGQAAMEGAFRTALARRPFALVEWHPDNGSEFFNAHLKRLYGEFVSGLALSRSRPYQKNDNRFVEQKNDSLVRPYVGYDRLDTPDQVAALNARYTDMEVYYNLFQPVLRLVEKTPVSDVDGRATRLRRRWDTAQTPFQRLCATGQLAPDQRARLQALYDQTNPLALRQRIYRQLAALWDAAEVAGTGQADHPQERAPRRAAPRPLLPPSTQKGVPTVVLR